MKDRNLLEKNNISAGKERPADGREARPPEGYQEARPANGQMTPLMRLLWDGIRIIAGAFILGLAINIFFEPCHIVAGGITGLGMVIREVLIRRGIDVPLWLANLVLNVPLFVGAYFINGRKFIVRTGIAMASLTLSLYISASWGYKGGETLINAIYGGILSGIGCGLVFSAQATTGGTDLLAAILHHFIRHLSVASLLFFTDFAVIVLSVLVFGMNLALYAIIGIYITSWVADRVVDGFHYSKAIFIISEKSDEIAARLMAELNRGATGIPAVGKYTGASKEMLYVVTSAREAVNAKRIVREVDPRAFMMLTDTKEVLGEGFGEYEAAK